VSNNKVLVTGCNGLLGATVSYLVADDYAVVASGRTMPVSRESVNVRDMDITEAGQVELVVQQVRPDVIFHCAAETRVDYCERHPEIAEIVNAEGTKNVALAAEACGAMIIYISSDSVFDGCSGDYKETDSTNPANVYSKTKVQGEQFVRGICARHLVVRTNMFGWNMKPKQSLSEWVLSQLRAGKRISGFTDVSFGPLIVNDLTELLLTMYRKGLQGTYHVAAGDSISKFEFAREIAASFGLNADLVDSATLESSELLAPRPKKTYLNTKKIEKDLARPMPTVRQGIARFYELEQSGYVEDLKSLFKGG
jgi:dTDP-4-dehydrorhamnose reductase